MATRVERTGVGALPPGEIPSFAARYREVAADLARARTYGVDPRVVEYLERLVSAGHNALYRSRGRRRPPLWRYVVADFPAAVVTSWRYVLVAFLLFAAPAVVGYGVARTRPELAEEVMPGMVSRAQQAADREARGQTYAQADPESRPPIAAWIISNNIWVCFAAFAGGLLAGLLTVYSLVFNGLMLGRDAARGLSGYDALAVNALDATVESLDAAAAVIHLKGEIRGAALGGEGTIGCDGTPWWSRGPWRCA